jgi:pimeloyl-ACP methyl ester carboxylesterase
MKSLLLCLLLASPFIIAGCGGDSTTRGTTTGKATPVTEVLRADVDAISAASGSAIQIDTALCGVKVSSVTYNTVGAKGEAATSSAAVMVPTTVDLEADGVTRRKACTGARPVVVYAHGTSIDKSFNMSNVATNAEAALVMGMYAAQGFIVVAPNYTGYAGSSLPYHPYLNAEAQTNDVIDAVRAARSVLAELGTVSSDKMFITGYSQGGHVALATHREMQTKYPKEFIVTASGPMSGPLSLEKFLTTVYAGSVNAGAPVFTPLIVDSYQNSYGNLYARASDIYQSPFDTTAVGLLPTADAATIAAFGFNKLPQNLFDSQGTPFLIKPSYRVDVQTNPNNGLRLAAKKNDLLGFKPTTPVVFCYGARDPVVFATNSQQSIEDMRALGVAESLLFEVDLEATIPPSKLAANVKADFDAKVTAAGTAALAKYHGEIVPPFCNLVVRSVFRSLL